MHITSLSADGFRNLRAVQMLPDPKRNVIIGDNAQGKTNLLDAIWLMTGCRNFHGAKERHYLGFDATLFQCGMQFFDGRREQKISYSVQRSDPKKKHIHINDVEIAGTGGLFEVFHCVAFSPSDVELIQDGPERRRAFMDLCACQLHPSGMGYVSRAARLLAQRNAALQSAGRIHPEAVRMWDAGLAAAGAFVSCMRAEYLRGLAPLCRKLYTLMTGGREQLEISYKSAVYGTQELPVRPTEVQVQQYLEMLEQNLEEDIRLGYTRKGIQRDDMQLLIDGNPVQVFGSQGQRKSTALVLKLAQAHLYNEKCHRSPVVLLDDVMGELDERRQRLIYDMVSDMQVFITLCQPSALQVAQDAQLWEMQSGQLRKL